MPSANRPPMLSGSLRIFQFAGISVFVHWSWLLVALFELQFRAGRYGSQFWNIAEYLALFAIVLIHEFGHALACRQVGGKADRIVLWPLGGIAFVSPPQRPGAVLWSIAAGPLVNVLLVPITIGAYSLAISQGLEDTNPDVARFLGDLAYMNLILLIFNLLPVYPLDGGQILQALLWFVIGRTRSLLVVSVIGLVVAAITIVVTLINWHVNRQIWLMIMAIFVAFRSWTGFQQARMMARIEQTPRNANAACPGCGVRPLVGEFWECERCRNAFDLFANGGICPRCGAMYSATACPECGRSNSIQDWYRAAYRR